MPLSLEEQNELGKIIKKLNISSHIGWENFSKNNHYPQAIVLDIENAKSLSMIMATIYKMNLNKPSKERIILRPASGQSDIKYAESFSFTPVVEADVIVRLVGEEFRQIKKTDSPKVMSIGASTQIGEVDRKLYDDYGLALPTASLIPYVTVAGLSANAGHGTGKDQPGFCGLIKKMKICLPNGEIVSIDKKYQDFETIRAAHLGLFGIVLEVELECTEAKKMHCVMEVSTIPDLIQKIKLGLFNQSPYVSVMYVPTYQENELVSNQYQNIIIYSWKPVDIKTPDKNSHPILSHLGQSLQVKVEEELNLTSLMKEHPKLIPYFTRYLVSSAAIGKKDSESIGPWYTMHYQTAFPRDIDDADYLFSVDKDSNQIVSAIEKVVNTLTKYAKSGKYPVLDAVYLRLFKGTNGGLSTSQDEKEKFTCGLDMVSSNGVPGYAQFKKEMANFFINGELSAKPHWGKYVPLEVNYGKMYGENYKYFVNVLKNWYQTHQIQIEKSMLLNRFSCDVLNFSFKPVPIQQYKKMSMTNIQFLNLKKITDHVCHFIEENTNEAKELKEKLQALGNVIYLGNQSPLFMQGLFLKREEELEQVKEKTCCVIL